MADKHRDQEQERREGDGQRDVDPSQIDERDNGGDHRK